MEHRNIETGRQLHVYTPTSDERIMAILSHILNIPAPVIAPLVIYLLKKDESPYVAAHAREALNFQITACIVTICLTITLIGIPLLLLVALVVFILIIVASVKASDNELYRYPLTLRLIK